MPFTSLWKRLRSRVNGSSAREEDSGAAASPGGEGASAEVSPSAGASPGAEASAEGVAASDDVASAGASASSRDSASASSGAATSAPASSATSEAGASGPQAADAGSPSAGADQAPDQAAPALATPDQAAGTSRRPVEIKEPASRTATATAERQSPTGEQILAEAAALRREAKIPVGMKVILVVALVTVCCAGIRQIQGIFAPAFFALTLVLTVRPIHRWLVRKGLPPFLSGLSTMLALAAVLLGVIGLTVWSLVRLPETLGRYSGNLQDLVAQLRELADKYDLRTDKLSDQILNNINTDQIVSLVTTVINYLTSTGTLVVLIAATMLFITVDTMTMKARSKIVDTHDSLLHQALSSFEGRVRQYWIVSTIFGIIVAIIDFFILRMLNVPEAFGWAMISFVTNYIPNIGFVLGVIPPALMGLIDSGWVTAVWVVVLYSVVNLVIQGIFQPKITGDVVGLSTTITFLSLLFWTTVIGPLGTILAVPLTLFAKAVLIDSSPQTRWLEVFLIPESEARKRDERGIYDEDNPAPDEFVDFMTAELMERESGRKPLLLRRSQRQ